MENQILDNLNMNDERTQTMIQVKTILESSIHYLEVRKNNNILNDYCMVLEEVNKYLKKYCNHKIIEDWIDIDPERGGLNIKYCEKCHITF